MTPIILIIPIALIVWGLYYRFSHRRDYTMITAPAGNFEFGTFNGTGTNLIGGFKSEYEDWDVYYAAITICWLPIIPYACLIASRGESSGIIFNETQFRIGGRTRWNLWELLNLYALRWGIFLLIFLILDIYYC